LLSSDLQQICVDANKDLQLKLDYKYNERSDPNRFYYRSDHYNFAKNGIPSVFLFSGTHADYHQPGDDVEKIEFDALTKRTRYAFAIAWELANRDKRPGGGQGRKINDKTLENPRLFFFVTFRFPYPNGNSRQTDGI
jgi:hypothetical protein